MEKSSPPSQKIDIQLDHIFYTYLLAVILGEAALSDTDKIFLEFSKRFKNEFVRQGPYEDRTIIKTLYIGWRLLAMLPRNELKRGQR